MQSRASIDTQVLYGVTLSLGVVPVILMILWTKYFTSRWLINNVAQASVGSK
jgi:hypothetical protein